MRQKCSEFINNILFSSFLSLTVKWFLLCLFLQYGLCTGCTILLCAALASDFLLGPIYSTQLDRSCATEKKNRPEMYFNWNLMLLDRI